MTQRAQRGQARHRQRRRLREADVVRQHRHAMRGHRDALRPTEFVGQHDDARAGRGATAILGLLQHDAGNVLPRHPAFAIVADRTQLAAIERERMDRDQRFVTLRLRFGNLAQFDRSLVVQRGDETKHRFALHCNSAR